MADSNQSSNPQHLYCLTQNRLGALDRVLGAFTHRGILPQQMTSVRRDDNLLEILLTFEKQDEKTIEKLVKFLQKQVYVLKAQPLQSMVAAKDSAESSKITPLFVSDVIQDQPQRRMAHVHNA